MEFDCYATYSIYIVNAINNIIKLANKFDILIKESKVSFLKVYHGTDAKNLPSILKDGLKMGEEGGVFITTDFDKAARYATFSHSYGEHERKAVLEINLTDPSQIKRIKIDENDAPVQEDFYEKIFMDLKKLFYALESFAETILGKKIKLSFYDLCERKGRHVIDIVKKTNIINFMMKQIAKKWEFKELMRNKYPKDTKSSSIHFLKILKRKMRDYCLSNKICDYINVQESGNLSFNEDYFKAMHQQIINDIIPAKKISYVWLSDILDENFVDEKDVGIKLLPQEGAQILGFIGDIKSSCKELLDRFIKNQRMFGDFKDIIDSFQRIKQKSAFDMMNVTLLQYPEILEQINFIEEFCNRYETKKALYLLSEYNVLLFDIESSIMIEDFDLRAFNVRSSFADDEIKNIMNKIKNDVAKLSSDEEKLEYFKKSYKEIGEERDKVKNSLSDMNSLYEAVQKLSAFLDNADVDDFRSQVVNFKKIPADNALKYV